MNKKLVLALIASLCVLNACGGDDSAMHGIEDLSCQTEDFKGWCMTSTTYTTCENKKVVIKQCEGDQICNYGDCKDKNNVDDMTCNSSDFKGWCKTATSYTICEGEKVTAKNCENNQICHDGGCIDKPVEKADCTPGSYQSLCDDDTHRTLCSEDGKVEIEACPANSACVDGVCKGGGTQCNDVGCACDSSFNNSCDNTKRIACDNGKITEYDCATDGLSCHEGECYVVGKLACDKTFENKCIGNNLLTCYENDKPIQQDDMCMEPFGYLELNKCDSYQNTVCATIGNVTDCYEPCTVEGEVLYEYCGYIGEKADKLTCTKTDLGLFYVPSEEDCNWCGEMVTGSGFATTSRGSLCVTEQCTYQEEARCDGNKAIGCSYNGDKIAFDCGQNKCVVYGDEAICAEECTAQLENTHKYICEQEFDDPDSLSVEYTSKDYVCTHIGEHYYWLLMNSNTCDNGCDATTNACKKLHADEGTSCEDTYEYATRCAGNVLLTCTKQYDYDPLNPGEDPVESLVWMACNCAASHSECVETYDATDDYTSAKCMELCTAADVQKPQLVCQDDRGGIFSHKKECVESNSKYYWHEVNTYCGFGCDDTTGQCIKIHDDEGKSCATTTAPICVNDDVVLYCDEDTEQYVAMSCKDYQSNNVATCNSDAASGSYNSQTGMLNAMCDRTCTADDVANGATKKYWDSLNERLDIYTCEPYWDDIYYWYYDSSMFCTHGYDATTESCVSIHANEFTECDYSNDYCEGSIYLACSGGYYVAEECPDECNDLIGCYTPCDDEDEEPVYQCSGDNSEYSIETYCSYNYEIDSMVYRTYTDYCGKNGCSAYSGKCRYNW